MWRVVGLQRLRRSRLPDRGVVKVVGRDSNVDFALDDGVPFTELEVGLRRYLRQSNGWFTAGAVTVNVGRRTANPQELGQIRHVFEDEFHLKVVRFWCRARDAEEAISEYTGVPISVVSQQPAYPGKSQTVLQGTAPLLVRGNCRSGTAILHDGDVVVRGDVNPGAQVTATGDIMVLGTLRGTVHAGSGDAEGTEATIMALCLQPLQLRIASFVSIAPPGKPKRGLPEHPEIAYVSGQSIVVAPYSSKFDRTLEH